MTVSRVMLYALDKQRVLGVVGLPVGECLEVGRLFVVLVQVTYPQEGSQHQGLSLVAENKGQFCKRLVSESKMPVTGSRAA